jgi:hypothetical protein
MPSESQSRCRWVRDRSGSQNTLWCIAEFEPTYRKNRLLRTSDGSYKQPACHTIAACQHFAAAIASSGGHEWSQHALPETFFSVAVHSLSIRGKKDWLPAVWH